MFQIRHLTVELFFVNDMDIYVEQQRLQALASKKKILFIVCLSKTDICIFSNLANDWQIHSGKVVQPEFQC